MEHTTQHAALIYQHANIGRQQAMAQLVSDQIERAIGEDAGTGGDDDGGNEGGSAGTQVPA